MSFRMKNRRARFENFGSHVDEMIVPSLQGYRATSQKFGSDLFKIDGEDCILIPTAGSSTHKSLQ